MEHHQPENLEEILKTLDRKQMIDLLRTADRVLEKVEVKKWDSYVPHEMGLDGGQKAFHAAAKTHKIRLLITGNRFGKCLSYHTLIESPDGKARKIGEIKDEHFVWAWDGQKRVPVLAEAPFKKPAEECFRVWMEDGRWFECAGNHRVLTQDGWQFFSSFQKSLPCLPPSNSGFGLLTRVEDVRRYLQKSANSQGNCFQNRHQCDAQPRFFQGSAQAPLPSQADVRQHTYFFEPLDVLARKCANILLFLRARLASLGVFFHSAAQFFLFLNQRACTVSGSNLHDTQKYLRFSNVATPHLRQGVVEAPDLSLVSARLVSPDGFSDNQILAYQSIGIQDIYDFHVPYYQNYCTMGAVHHNTTCSIKEIEMLATGTHPHLKIPIPNRGKLYGDSYSMVMENIYLKFKEWVNPALLDQRKPFEFNNQGLLTGINWRCGSITKIGSYDQETRKAEGSNWHYVAYDEPPPRELYIANMRGLVDFGGITWVAATPLSEPWIFDDLWMPGLQGQKPYIKCFRGTSDDNPHIDKAQLSLFLEELTEEEKNIRFYGHFARLSGLVINTYDPQLSDIDWFQIDDNFCLYEGIDPHSKKPHAVLWKAINREGFRFVVDELSFDGKMEDFAFEIIEKRKELTAHGAVLVKSVIDSAINQEDLAFKANQYNELKKFLRQNGETVLPAIAAKGRGSLLSTIQILKDLYRPVRIDKTTVEDEATFNEKHLYDIESQNFDKETPTVKKLSDILRPMQYIFPNCVKYKKELLHYQWPKDPSSDDMKPIDKNNEYISCDRYIEQTAPRFQTPGSCFIKTLPEGYNQRNYGKRERRY